MDNQFCKSCGQANFPNASVCSKCGQALSPAENRPFNQPNQQQQNFGGQNQAPKSAAAPKKSNTKFWVIGGIAVFLVLAIGVIGIAAVGGLLYFNSQPGDEVAYDDPGPDKSPVSDDDTDTDSDKPLDDIDFPSSDDTNFGGDNGSPASESTLVEFFKQKKSRVGSFGLDNVKTVASDGSFPNKSSGVVANYSSGSTNITHQVFVYESNDLGRTDFTTYKQVLKKVGAKFRTQKKDQVIFTRKGIVVLGFLNPQGGIHVISSKSGSDIITYYNAYFK